MSKIQYFILALLSTTTSWANPQFQCRSLYSHSSDRPFILYGPSGTVSIGAKHGDVLQKASDFEKALSNAPSEKDRRIILGEISEYAATLIKDHENEKFLLLAQLTSFPINKSSFEDYNAPFFYYGRSLLEVAILSKNYEIYQKLSTLARDNQWPEQQTAYLNQWSQPVAKTVLNDPVFYKDIHVLQTKYQSDFHPRMATFGSLTKRALEHLKEISETKNLKDLMTVLKDIFPSGEMAGRMANAKGEGTQDIISFKHDGYKEARPDPFLQVSILDSKEYYRGVFSSGYRRIAKFNLQAYQYKTKPNEFFGNYYWLDGSKVNWIKQMDVSENSVRILLERDRDGIFYDRGSRYQELTLNLDSSGGVQKVSIRNGDSLLFKFLWLSQTIEIPAKSKSFSGVSFLGEEDQATTDFGD